MTRPPVAILMEKCTGTIQKTGTVTKRGATMKDVPVQFFTRYKNIGYHNCFPVYEKNISLLLPFFPLKTFFFLSFFSFSAKSVCTT